MTYSWPRPSSVSHSFFISAEVSSGMNSAKKCS